MPLVGSWRQQSGAKLYVCLSWILPRSYSLSRSPQWQPWPQHGDCPYSLNNLVSPINARRAHCSPWLRLLMKMLSSINPQDQHNFPFISLKKKEMTCFLKLHFGICFKITTAQRKCLNKNPVSHVPSIWWVLIPEQNNNSSGFSEWWLREQRGDDDSVLLSELSCSPKLLLLHSEYFHTHLAICTVLCSVY